MDNLYILIPALDRRDGLILIKASSEPTETKTVHDKRRLSSFDRPTGLVMRPLCSRSVAEERAQFIAAEKVKKRTKLLFKKTFFSRQSPLLLALSATVPALALLSLFSAEFMEFSLIRLPFRSVTDYSIARERGER